LISILSQSALTRLGAVQANDLLALVRRDHFSELISIAYLNFIRATQHGILQGHVTQSAEACNRHFVTRF
jgi:hypothetical protein